MIFRCLLSIAHIVIGCILIASGSSFAQSDIEATDDGLQARASCLLDELEDEGPFDDEEDEDDEDV